MKGPYGELNFGQTFQDKIRDYLKENLCIDIEIKKGRHKYIEVRLKLNDEVIACGNDYIEYDDD